MNDQLAVPPGTSVKLAPKFKVLPAAARSPTTPTAEPVAPCGAASYVPVYPFTVTNATALLITKLPADKPVKLL